MGKIDEAYQKMELRGMAAFWKLLFFAMQFSVLFSVLRAFHREYLIIIFVVMYIPMVKTVRKIKTKKRKKYEWDFYTEVSNIYAEKGCNKDLADRIYRFIYNLKVHSGNVVIYYVLLRILAFYNLGTNNNEEVLALMDMIDRDTMESFHEKDADLDLLIVEYYAMRTIAAARLNDAQKTEQYFNEAQGPFEKYKVKDDGKLKAIASVMHEIVCGSVDEAERMIEEYFGNGISEGTYWIMMGRCAFKRGDIEKGNELFEKAKALENDEAYREGLEKKRKVLAVEVT